MEEGKDAIKMSQKRRHMHGRHVTGTVGNSCLFDVALEGNGNGKKIIRESDKCNESDHHGQLYKFPKDN